MMVVGVFSYLVGALAHLFLAILLTLRRPKSPEARWLILASVATALWCVTLASREQAGPFPSALLWTVEPIHQYVWVAFVGRLMGRYNGVTSSPTLLGVRAIRITMLALVLVLILASLAWVAPPYEQSFPRLPFLSTQAFGQITLSVVGLALVEQFLRFTRADQRWRIKFFCLAIGGMFAYDFFLYTDALLAGRINPALWAARGAVTALIVPLMAIAVARNPEWKLDLYLSRRIAFQSAAVLAAGVYLLSIGIARYYIQTFGGEWAPVIQIVFTAAASLALVALLFSAHIRARVRVFLSKNFFKHAYDYREEWLKLIRTLSDAQCGLSLGERIIFAIGRLVESPSGVLWVKDSSGFLIQRAVYGDPAIEVDRLDSNDPLIAYMVRREWIVNLIELESMPKAYEGLARPPWLPPDTRAWLVLPLFRDENSLYGVLLLTEPRTPVQPWDWEVRDLLKTATRLSASYLALEDAGRQLTEAKQFDGFNRLSAFVMHDLKNLIAQLSLVIRNADRHQHNPDFVQDAFRTLGHVVERMHRLMNQLKSASPSAVPEEVDLLGVINEVIATRRNQAPELITTNLAPPVIVMANHDRLFSAVEHIVQNAQEAAGKHGRVVMRLGSQGGDQILFDVEDTGPGMSAEFIRNRLFKPFDSTKGMTGMGIGAYESREYIRSLGGDVLVKSELGKGSRFRLVLPRKVNSVERVLQKVGCL